MCLQICIANTVLQISASGLAWQFSSRDPRRQFTSDLRPDAVVLVQPGDVRPPTWSEIFNAGASNYTVYARDQQVAFYVRASISEMFLDRLAVFSAGFTEGEITVSLPSPQLEVLPYPLEYPLEELWFVNLLGSGRGVMLHACSVLDEGKATLFLGPSGAGKSTMARLWHERGAIVLGDDRVVVRMIDDRMWAYGTPWVGETGLFSPGGGPIEKICLLHHAPGNRMTLARPRGLVARLFSLSYPALYRDDAVQFTLDFLHRMVEAVPVYELGFVPAHSVVDFCRAIN